MVLPPEITSRESLQSKKQAVVRQEVWSAAIDLFHSEGFDQVTIEQIASRAGVSRRTFFRYFSSKEDVLASSVRNFVDALSETIKSDDSAAGSLLLVKRALPIVLEPFLPSAERVMQIATRSVSARSAQVHQGPVVQQKLVEAFAFRANRASQPRVEDRVLAGLTLFATSLCLEMWVEQRERSLTDIAEEVFSTFSSACQLERH